MVKFANNGIPLVEKTRRSPEDSHDGQYSNKLSQYIVIYNSYIYS